MMKMISKLKHFGIVFLLAIIFQVKSESCSYGLRGSLTKTCYEVSSSQNFKRRYKFNSFDKTVRCVRCRLSTIESDSFDLNDNGIKTLDLSKNQISYIKPNAFVGLVYLQNLVLSHNYLDHVSPAMLTGIKRLLDLNLEQNLISKLVTNGFKELENLRKLNLRFNVIKSFQQGCFRGLDSLEVLDLSWNNIETVKYIFSDIPNVKAVLLENNKLIEFNPSDSIPLFHLSEFNLSGNKLKNLKPYTFRNYPSLKKLNLSLNPIDSIDVASFGGLLSLDDLDLRRCNIKKLRKGVFQNMDLKTLDLSYNALSNFTPGVYTGLPGIKILNLSHNSISIINEPGVFKINNLHTLDLSHNNLKELNYHLFDEYMPGLSTIDLSYNNLSCSLGEIMEEHFKNDNLMVNLGEGYEKCNEKLISLTTESEIREILDNRLQFAQKSSATNNCSFNIYFASIFLTNAVMCLFQCVWKLELVKLSTVYIF